MNNIVTENWDEFGFIEIEEAKELLSHIKEIDSYGQVKVMFNKNSGYVFLCDSDYRVWMMNEGNIEEVFSCPYCGNEGFKKDLLDNPCNEDEECKEFIKSLKGEER